jgi:hypothetical protein
MSQLGMLPPGLLQQLVMGAQQVPPTSPPQMTMGAQPAPPTSPPFMAGLQGMGLAGMFAQTPAGQAGGVPAPAPPGPAAPSPITQQIQNGPWRTTSQYTQGPPEALQGMSIDDLAKKINAGQPMGDWLSAHLPMGHPALSASAYAPRVNPYEKALALMPQYQAEQRLATLGQGNLGIAQQAENRQLVHGNQDLALKAQEFAQKMDPTFLSRQVGMQALLNGQSAQQAAYRQAEAAKMLSPRAPSGPGLAGGASPQGTGGATPISQLMEDLAYTHDATGAPTTVPESVGSFLWKLNNNDVDVPGRFANEIAPFLKQHPAFGEQALRDAAAPTSREKIADTVSLGALPVLRALGYGFDQSLHNNPTGRGKSALRNLISQDPRARAAVFGQ